MFVIFFIRRLVVAAADICMRMMLIMGVSSQKLLQCTWSLYDCGSYFLLLLQE
jgi:hypothetical protein